MSDHRSSILRQQVHQRAKAQCEYCQTTELLTGFALEIDHIIPQALGGESTLDNLCLACRRCNAHKAYRQQVVDSQSKQLVALFNPRQQFWSDHFVWSDEGTHIKGLTTEGRATIEALQMNDPLIVRSRGLWVSAGWHPPDD
jgi:hypothetical protein